jgi:hypothetical protein
MYGGNPVSTMIGYNAPAVDGRIESTGGYRPQALDTDEATDRYLFERLRVLQPWHKAEMLSAATRGAFDLAMAGLRQRHPAAPDAELRKRYAALVLGRAASIALFDWDPEHEGW